MIFFLNLVPVCFCAKVISQIAIGTSAKTILNFTDMANPKKMALARSHLKFDFVIPK